MKAQAAEAHTRSPSSTERVRLHRKRHRNGMRLVPVLLHESEIDSLIRQRYLKAERRHLSDTILEQKVHQNKLR